MKKHRPTSAVSPQVRRPVGAPEAKPPKAAATSHLTLTVNPPEMLSHRESMTSELNQFSPPKYFQITRELIARIQQGELPAGASVPSENELIEHYQISNTTARKVLSELERGSWVTRIKGKGTFVRDFAVVRAIDRIFGFTKNMVEAGRKPATRLLGFHLRDDDHRQTINGRQFTLKGPFCEIERLRLADGIPMMWETRYISLKLCPGIQQRNLEGSLYDIFQRDYGIQLTEIVQMLSAVVLGVSEIKPFRLTQPVPAFRVEGASFAGKSLIVEMENSVYRGDMYRFSARATPTHQSVPPRLEKG
jgi:GntR family transcriptional regulator